MADVKLVDRNIGTTNGQREWGVGVVNEVVTVDGSLLASLCPLIAHVVDRRSGNEHLEVVLCNLAVLVVHENLVVNNIRDITRNGNNQGVVSNQTRNQLGFLVVEIHLDDAAQVVTNDADTVVHIGTGQ